MERELKKTILIGVAIFIVTIALVTAPWVIRSYFEARAFENVTGKKVSTWDAMFIELRVQEPPLKDTKGDSE